MHILKVVFVVYCATETVPRMLADSCSFQNRDAISAILPGTNTMAIEKAATNGNGTKHSSKNGQVVIGDPEFDGRTIIYVIKGVMISGYLH